MKTIKIISGITEILAFSFQAIQEALLKLAADLEGQSPT